MSKSNNNTIIFVTIAILVVGGLGGYLLFGSNTEVGEKTESKKNDFIDINGAGASFPFPLVSNMIEQYFESNPTIRINYQSIGSGGGVRQHTEKTVHFGISDAPLKDSQFADAPNSLHIPITIGAVVVPYNIPGVDTGLKLTGEIVADIFLGKITKWNDPAITTLNPDVELPDKAIVVVHRSDGSGTSFIFTSWLAEVSADWEKEVGAGKAVEWPTGLGAAGNEGVAGVVNSNEYTIGYIELAYVIQNNTPVAALENPAGYFVLPSLETASEAARGAGDDLPSGKDTWSKVEILNSPGSNSYPVVSFSYMLLYQELNVIPDMDEKKAKALLEFTWWAVHDGQEIGPTLEYVPLPDTAISINETTLKSITFNGEPIL